MQAITAIFAEILPMDLDNLNLAEKDRFVAYVGMYGDNDTSIWGQYQRLVDFIFKTYPDTGRRFDEIAIPTLHTISHGVELAIKENIKFFNDYSESEHVTKFGTMAELLKSHDLSDMAAEFKMAYMRLNRKLRLGKEEQAEFNKYFGALEKLIKILERSSETYRYSTKIGKNGEFIKMSIDGRKKVDFLALKALLDPVEALFIGAPNSVGHYTDFIDYQRAHPEYKRGKGFLYCQRLHYTKWYLEQLITRFDKELTKVRDGVWFDPKRGENFEIQVWNNDIYIIAINPGRK